MEAWDSFERRKIHYFIGWKFLRPLTILTGIFCSHWKWLVSAILVSGLFSNGKTTNLQVESSEDIASWRTSVGKSIWDHLYQRIFKIFFKSAITAENMSCAMSIASYVLHRNVWQIFANFILASLPLKEENQWIIPPNWLIHNFLLPCQVFDENLHEFGTFDLQNYSSSKLSCRIL